MKLPVRKCSRMKEDYSKTTFKYQEENAKLIVHVSQNPPFISSFFCQLRSDQDDVDHAFMLYEKKRKNA